MKNIIAKIKWMQASRIVGLIAVAGLVITGFFVNAKLAQAAAPKNL